MSAQDYNTLRSLKLHEITNDSHNKQLVRQYVNTLNNSFMRKYLLKLTN
jgi:hypothetical protein